MAEKLKVVFDVNVYVDAIIGRDSTYPYLQAVPPKSENAAADALSMAFDGEDFYLFTSPHILKNIRRILGEVAGLSQNLVEEILVTITEIVHFSGGSVVDPPRSNLDQKDFEDNLVLDLVKAVRALILVTSDAALLRQSPWHGRLFLNPRHFVEQLILSR